ALTFKITNGDVEVNTSTGRPKMIGNALNENIFFKAKEKTSQDMRRSLSINRIRNGTGAGMAELVGTVQQVGFLSIKVLLQRQILNMFSSLIRQQSIRPGVRPRNERFKKITLFRILPSSTEKTSYIFRLDVTTVGGGKITESGTITGV
ncbi:hypothetical protein LCGC14_2186910, partial [marine sediment metagenome]